MAAGSDGSIVLDVRINKDGLNNELNALKNNINSNTKGIKGFGNAISSVTGSLGKFATAVGVAFSAAQIIRFSNEASKLASETEAYLKRINTIYGESGNEVYKFIEKNAAALGMAKTTAYEAATSYGNLFATFTDSANNAKLTNQMLQATAVIASQTGRTYDDVFEKIRSGLYGNIRAIDDLGISVRKATIENSESFQQISQGVINYNDLTDAQMQQIRALEILRQTHALYGYEVINSTSLARSQFDAAFQDFKASWGAVVNIVLIPVLNVLTTILNYATRVLNMISGLTGKKNLFSGPGISNVGVSSGVGSSGSGTGKKGKGTKGSSGKSPEEKEIEKQIKAIQKKNKELQKEKKAQQKLNKEQNKQLASFDTLEILQAQRNDEALDALDDEIDKNNEIIDQLREKLQLLQEARQEQAASSAEGAGAGGGVGGVGGDYEIGSMGDEGFLTQGDVESEFVWVAALGGLALVGLGIFVMFAGHFWLGLGMVVLGAMTVWTAAELTEFTADSEIIQEKLGNVLTIAGVVAVMLGILLLFTPAKKFGLGLIVEGIAAVAGAAYLQKFGYDLKPYLEKVLVISGVIAFMLGVILCFIPGTTKYGLYLMGIGAAAVAGSAALGGDVLKQELETVCTNLWPVIFAIAYIAIVIGCVLLFVSDGIYWQQGVTCIIAGISVIEITKELGGDPLKAELEAFCTQYWKILFSVAHIMIVVGIIVLFMSGGKYWGQAITLIVAGISIITETVSFGGDPLKAELEAFCTKYWTLLYGIAVIAVVVGIAILFQSGGSAWKEALTLIVSGIAILVETTEFGGVPLKVELETFVNNYYKEIIAISALAFVVGIALLFTPLFGVGIALIVGSAGSLIKATELDATSFKTKIQGELDDIYTTVDTNVKKINKRLGNIYDVDISKNKKNFENSLKPPKYQEQSSSNNGRKMPALNGIKMPALAKGAVLPANKRFLAVLGDQKNGKNLEAPAELIKQMAKQAIIESQATLQSNQQTIREEHYYLDQTELMSILYKLVKGGERISGTSLVNN